MFLSTFEKQLDSKRRIVVPQEFRAAAGQSEGERTATGFDGVFCFPSIEADCIEGGGQALLSIYQGLIGELAFGDPLRSALEFAVLGQMRQLAFDGAGRIVLPEALCEQFGLTDWVAVVGLGDRFQIMSQAAYRTRLEVERRTSRDGLAALRTGQRPKVVTA